jgi:excisionase family DNA binding protein
MKALTKAEMTELFESSFKKKFLSVVEAAAYTGFSPKYIYQLVHRGEIPYHKPTGRKLFFKVEDLDNWISISRYKSVNEIYLDFQNAPENL